MLLNRRNILVLLIILAMFTGGYFYYRHLHPKYVPLPPRSEISLTIIPGWNLRQVAEYLVSKKLATSTEDVYAITGQPARIYKPSEAVASFGPADDLLEQKPFGLSMEGYLAPETIRVFADADLAEGVIDKFYFARKKELTPEMFATVSSTHQTMHQILTLASIVEKEAQTPEDMAIVADIFWRRLKQNWALQSCATVNYITGKKTPAISAADQKIDSSYNTYKYPGLPPGPICNPSLDAIKAVIYPEKNDYWYFLTGSDGEMHYAKTLEEHNSNKYKYL